VGTGHSRRTYIVPSECRCSGLSDSWKGTLTLAVGFSPRLFQSSNWFRQWPATLDNLRSSFTRENNAPMRIPNIYDTHHSRAHTGIEWINIPSLSSAWYAPNRFAKLHHLRTRQSQQTPRPIVRDAERRHSCRYARLGSGGGTLTWCAWKRKIWPYPLRVKAKKYRSTSPHTISRK